MTSIGARRVAFAFALLLTPVGVKTAAACSCASNPPCAAVWQADAIFVGTVVDNAPLRVGKFLSVSAERVAVHQVVRGSVESVVTLVSDSPTKEKIAASDSNGRDSVMFSTCDYGFRVGRG